MTKTTANKPVGDVVHLLLTKTSRHFVNSLVSTNVYFQHCQ